MLDSGYLHFKTAEEIIEEEEKELYYSDDSILVSEDAEENLDQEFSPSIQTPKLQALDLQKQISKNWMENHKNRLHKILQRKLTIKDEGCVLTERNQTIFKKIDASNSVVFEYRKIKEIDLIRRVLLFLQGFESDLYSKTVNENDGSVFFKVDMQSRFALSHLSLGGQISLFQSFADVRNRLENIRRWKYKSLKKYPSSLTIRAFNTGIEKELEKVNTAIVHLELIYCSHLSSEINNQKITSISLLSLFNQVKRLVDAPLKWITNILDEIRIPEGLPNHSIAASLQHILLSILSKSHEYKSEQIYLCERLFLKSIMPTFHLFSNYFSSLEFYDTNNEFFLGQNDVENSSLPLYFLNYRERLLSAKSARSMIHATAPCAKYICQNLEKEFCVKKNSIGAKETPSPKIQTWLLKTLETKEKSSISSIMKEENFESYLQAFESLVKEILEPTFVSIEQEMHQYLFETIKIDKYLESFQSICFFQSISNSSCLFCEKVSNLSRLEEWRVEHCLMESINLNENLPEKDLLSIRFKSGANNLIINNSRELNPFKFFDLHFDVPWPINQILTDENQRRYSDVFCFLADLYLSKKRLNESRLNFEVCQARLYALSFVNSLSSYSIHNVIIPIMSNINWREFRSLNEIIAAHENMLHDIELKLFFKAPAIKQAIEEVLLNSRLGIYDSNLSLFLSSSIMNMTTELIFDQPFLSA